MSYRTFFLVATLLLTGCADPRPEPLPGVVLVIVDTARADHFGIDGYPRDTTPNFDRLAEDGAWYGNAWSQSPWTLPSIASILTGQLPSVHGAGMVDGSLHSLRSGIPTLGERLREHQFQTGAVMNVVFCNPASGLDRGFESYDFRTSDASNRGHRNAAATTDAALGWVSQVTDRPFFLLVHYFDAHLTYDPPEPFDTLFLETGTEPIPRGFGSAEQVMALRDGSIPMTPQQRQALVARYDGELRFLDQEFGRLRTGLQALGRWDDSMIVVVGDHGEEFWDHGGFEHGHSHHRELLRVPLIVRTPGGEPGAHRAERVRQIDILPTVLSHLGIPSSDDLPGQVLGTGHADRSIAEGSLWAGNLVSVRTDDGTLILNRDTGEAHLYGPEDPMETRALPADTTGLVRKLGAVLPQGEENHDGDTVWTPDAEEIERLRSLGYIQ